MRIVSGLAVVLLSLCAVCIVVLTPLHKTAGRSSSHHPRAQLHVNTASYHQAQPIEKVEYIQGEYLNVRTELGLEFFDAVFASSPYQDSAEGSSPTSHLLLPVLVSSSSAIPARTPLAAPHDRPETSDLSSALRDEQWHDVGLRRMLRRRERFGLDPGVSSVSGETSQRSPSPHVPKSTPINPPPEPSSPSPPELDARSHYISQPSSRPLFLAIDSLREPKTTAQFVLSEYSRFAANSEGRTLTSPGDRTGMRKSPLSPSKLGEKRRDRPSELRDTASGWKSKPRAGRGKASRLEH